MKKFRNVTMALMASFTIIGSLTIIGYTVVNHFYFYTNINMTVIHL